MSPNSSRVAPGQIRSWARSEGQPYPLGVSWLPDQEAYNFALYSQHATSVRLLLYADDFVTPRFELLLNALRNKSGRVWHCRVDASIVSGCRYYAYCVDGPESGPSGLRAFHPEKVLVDPYTRCVFFPSDFDRNSAIGDRPNAGKAPLGVIPLCEQPFDWAGDRTVRYESDAIIYELHVKGFTAHSSVGIASELRGRFAGVVAKIPYLLELGVNIVELMPVFQFDPQSGEFWGYMPLSFFAPHHAYAHDASAAIDEFRAMVKALHDAGIEVVLDVVYNHTAEGNEGGPIYAYKGIDNATYYLMNSGSASRYADYSGTGNSLNCNNRYVRKMIVDSMRYWVRQMHVDGFRFDLASVFTRNADGSINFDDPPIFGDFTSDPEFDDLRMIAEPWDAAGANELGRSFPGTTWLQWNGQFRDDVRRFVRGDSGMVGALMQRLYGSDDIFPDDAANAYHAYQSVNYVTSHDGFTLYDLVAYNYKRNWQNGHGNLDGPQENYSWNCGWEGDTHAPSDVLGLRERQAKNFMALLFLSNGTPMLRAGDEFLNSQGGNSNPYNQDNETGWLDWSGIERHAGYFRFVKQLIAFRKSHPSLGRSRFWRDDVRWFGARGAVDFSPESRAVALCLRGASLGDDDLYVMVNAGADEVTFAIQDVRDAPWQAVFDTARASPDDFVEPATRTPLGKNTYEVGPRSVVVLIRSSEARVAR